MNRIARQSKRAQLCGLFNHRAALGLVFGHCLLPLPQAFLFLFEQRFGTFLGLMRMHAISTAFDVICSFGSEFGEIPVTSLEPPAHCGVAG